MIDLKDPKYKKLRAFTSHGASLHSVSGEQAMGDCPFCGKIGKFYVQYEKLLWDCKVCAASGNFHTFLEKINERNKKLITQKEIDALAANRGLPTAAFKWLELGYHGQYTIAVRNATGKLIDLRIYKLGSKTISTAGAELGLLGLPELIKAKGQPAYICEGEWDTVAMQWLLDSNKKPGRAVCSPGANTFKPEWADFFQNRAVNVLYDNDGAGLKGEKIVIDRLMGKVKQMKFLHWPMGLAEGYDVRDFVTRRGVAKNTPKRCYRMLHELLIDKPRGEMDKEMELAFESNKPPDVDPSVKIQDVLKAYDQLLFEPNHMSIEISLIIMAAGLFDEPPIWIFLVAPPSSGKTAVIQGTRYLCQPYDTFGYAVSAITPHALVSGMETKRGDPSVFAKLNGTRKSLIVKDFTTVTSMPESEKQEVNASFRDAYDGYTSKSFGNGIVREYNKLKFSMLAGVTDDIYNESVTFNALGERFAKLNIGRSNDIQHSEQAIDKSIGSRDTFKDDEDRCAKLVYSCVKNVAARVEAGAKLPSISPELRQAITGLSLYVAAMRGVVSRDRFRRDYIKSAPYNETGIRFAKMITTVAAMRALFYGRDEATLEDLPLIRKIALDTVSQRDEEILRRVFLLNREEADRLPIKNIIQEGSKYTHYTVHCVLEDLVMLDMLIREKSGSKWIYRLSDKTKYIIDRAKLYETKEDLERNNHKVILKRAPTGMGDPRSLKTGLLVKRGTSK